MKKPVTMGISAALVIGIVVISGCTGIASTSTVVVTATPARTLSLPVPVIIPEKAIGTVPVTVSVIPSSAITTEKTWEPVSDSALKARVQEAKNKLNLYKDSDMADTRIDTRGDCEEKKSKELGCVIDVHTGEMNYVKGDYGSISLDLFIVNMIPGHTYIILHSHSKNWIICEGEQTINFDTFSLNDLAVGDYLTKRGYHIQNMIVVSDKDYGIYPVMKDDWKTTEEVYHSVDLIEQRKEVSYHTEYNGVKYYDVDNLMPLLTRELGYTYTVNNKVVNH